MVPDLKKSINQCKEEIHRVKFNATKQDKGAKGRRHEGSLYNSGVRETVTEEAKFYMTLKETT